jgi:CBS domain-containing protein
MWIKDVMTRRPAVCNPADTIDAVARQMLEYDCGEIPVLDGKTLIGVITDRDITCRAVATGKRVDLVTARDIMSRDVTTIGEMEKLDTALDLMERKLIRRLPVVDDRGEVVGIISQADLVARVPTLKVARALKSVSKKTRRHAIAAL